MAESGTVVTLYTDEDKTKAVFPVTTVTAVTGAQPTLVSGTNIKTINGNSIVGEGDIVLTKTSLGLSNVDNTSDANKPISTATQTALDSKQATLVSGTNIKTINSNSILGSGNLSIQDKPTVYSNISVSVTPVAMSSYCSWDTLKKYGYRAAVTINGLTTNSLVQNIVMTDTLLGQVAYIATTGTNCLYFYTEDATALSGTIFSLVVSEV